MPEGMQAREDPLVAFQWILEIENLNAAHFVAVQGLGSECQMYAYREAGQHQLTRFVPGRMRTQTLHCEYGLTPSPDLFEWAMKCIGGEVDRRDASIQMLDSRGAEEKLRFNLYSCWACAWNGAPLNTLEGGVAIASFSMCYEYLELG